MTAEIGLEEAASLQVHAWSVVEGELRLTFAESPEERALKCVCDRRHWIVETRVREGRKVLAVRCHSCGRNRELTLESLRIPPP